MSDTPRTDDILRSVCDLTLNETGYHREAYTRLLDHARQLEREAAERDSYAVNLEAAAIAVIAECDRRAIDMKEGRRKDWALPWLDLKVLRDIIATKPAASIPAGTTCEHKWVTDGIHPTACSRCGVRSGSSEAIFGSLDTSGVGACAACGALPDEIALCINARCPHHNGTPRTYTQPK